MKNIWIDMNQMHKEMDALMNHFLRSNGPTKKAVAHKEQVKECNDTRVPYTIIDETDASVIATFELPGASKDDIELNVTKDSIEVKAEQKIEQKHEVEEGCCVSMKSHVFYRSMPLPCDVKSEDAAAFYKDGVLKVAIPKLASDKKKRVDVQ